MSTKTNTHLLTLFFLLSVIYCDSHPQHHHLRRHKNIHDQFKLFHRRYERPYHHGSSEYKHRFQAFKVNLELIDKFNSIRNHNDSARYGITKFSDLTPKEFKERYLSGLHNTKQKLLYSTQKGTPDTKYIKGSVHETNSVLKMHNVGLPSNLPLKVDLAFSVVEMVESIAAMQSQNEVPLSVQEVIDCSKAYAGLLYGCKGGDTCHALQWLKEKKIPLVPATAYPLTDKTETCYLNQTAKGGVIVTDFTCEELSSNEEKIQLYLATVGPVTASVDATTWSNYMGGIIQFHCGENSNNHAVLIVGYDRTGEIPYYIVKNSWGEDFGDDGYLYIMMGGNTCGIFLSTGIAHEVSTAKVKM